MFLTGCSIASELVAPTANFALGLYDANTYVSKDCMWYKTVVLTPETKEWISSNNPPDYLVRDLSAIAMNNDLAKELCSEKK